MQHDGTGARAVESGRAAACAATNAPRAFVMRSIRATSHDRDDPLGPPGALLIRAGETFAAVARYNVIPSETMGARDYALST
ncbi:MAG: hypothetical protein NVSMB19_06360 [Vulcanimicrobiaceae bacterium]